MNALPDYLKKGSKLVKVLAVGGIETASIVEVAAVDKKRGLLSTDIEHVSKPKDIENDGVQTYRLSDGRANANYIPGCTSRLIFLEE